MDVEDYERVECLSHRSCLPECAPKLRIFNIDQLGLTEIESVSLHSLGKENRRGRS